MIPKLHYISQGKTAQEHLNNIQSACGSGAELVQLRLKNYSESEVLKTAKEARKITAHFQTRLIINDHYQVAKAVKTDGVHLGKNDACPSVVRKELERWQVIGGTANTLEDCEVLIAKEVDYIGLGPFKFTTTKKNLSPVLGLAGYRAILDALQTRTPIIAVGGIDLKSVSDILETGLYGVAVSGAISQNFNSIGEFKELLNRAPIQDQVWTPNQKK